MWDKPTLLNWIANLLFALSVVAMLYAALYAVVHLPIFPLREVKIDGQLNHVSREQDVYKRQQRRCARSGN